jgi:lipoprotein signal peptidase
VTTAEAWAGPSVRTGGAGEVDGMPRQPLVVAGIVALIASVDQTSKAWAWRHLLDVHINAGGDLLVGSGIGAWFSDPVRGAAFDVIDAVLLATAALLLSRRRRSGAVLVSAAVVLAGWSSNLLDRLGLHYWTAPGSVRGVVDFVPWGGRYWNVADLAIIAGSTGLALSLLAVALRALVHPRCRVRTTRAAARPLASMRARMAAAAGVLTTAVLAVSGAVAYAGVSGPVDLLASAR